MRIATATLACMALGGCALPNGTRAMDELAQQCAAGAVEATYSTSDSPAYLGLKDFVIPADNTLHIGNGPDIGIPEEGLRVGDSITITLDGSNVVVFTQTCPTLDTGQNTQPSGQVQP